MASVTAGDLATLAELVKTSTATSPADVATEVTATVLTERNLTPAPWPSRPKWRERWPQCRPAAAPGPFVSVRRFT